MAIGNIGAGNTSTMATISKTAQAILDIRAAHEANDRAVLAAYGLAPDTPEPEIVAHLFGLYGKMMKETKRTEATKATSDKVTAASLRSLEGGSNG